MFTVHLSETIKHLTRYKQKAVLAAMLEGKSMPYNMAANTNHATKAGRFSATTSSQQARAGRKTHADIVLDKKPALDLPPGSI